MKKSMIVFAMLATAVVAAPPEVSNVRASQREGTKLVDIWYDATDADNDLLKVRVQVSSNAGVDYNVPALTFTGDFGDSIVPGQNKHIVWDAGNDWDGEYSDQMRIKITVTDAKGFPGLEWGNEVPPGGFLLGQDGGAEGSGPAKQVNIPWSFWLSKYEITASQYCEFLNTALTCGKIKRKANTTTNWGGYNIYGTNVISGLDNEVKLITVSDKLKIRWNVMQFEVVGNYSNYPVATTFYGALAFANFYGYDLPTYAEWEKCARGNNGNFGEHQCYTWGNEVDNTKADFGDNSGYYVGGEIGRYPTNYYGCCDIIGNVGEYVRIKSYPLSIEDYPSVENLITDFCNSSRGYGKDKIYENTSSIRGEEFIQGSGFRVCRRFIEE